MTTPAHRDCTAFRLADLRDATRSTGHGGSAGMDDDTVVYVWHDDLSVVTDPLVPGGPVLLDAASAARDTRWQHYCRDTLQLMTPAPQNNGGTAQ